MLKQRQDSINDIIAISSYLSKEPEIQICVSATWLHETWSAFHTIGV